ncbi:MULTISPECIES: DNA-processing protein DprA [unclassified Pseudomonas]|uniref:DNA-processing protein DprA n=1 Tax=unclassified Pseudomonas TaxID=196821 RepID=UPI000C88E964|nr:MULTISPECIES: DNA-processing protein DprA [unclassified Pseudomonas]PMZ96776.1 DNA-protecting protein DprA [Pseudomonas sp. FW305-42]PNA28224.1 DNA-protecting protein DprA [Pseudomonas sp. MPR-R1B]PNB28690.1 DNA-protecting protein DprA [Pseudomonas sp. DP16D-E2]PNB45563.1 DNA-protecting protein DprA [Pseudomonas sp. FW305-17]PNB64417.1 DNA-protecting protein DprA [Pseudomonas sp. GW531-E2]
MNTLRSSPCSPAELEARLRLHRLPDIGLRRFLTLIEAFGNASSALSAPASAWRALGLPAASIDARRSPEVRDGALAAMAWLERPGQHLLMWGGPGYPALLSEIDDPPPLLFVAGDPALLEHPQLAIVGSRRASPPALDTAAAFSHCLAQAGFTITSGLALGVDGAAHRAALKAGGQTIGVLGTGLQKLYPQRHRDLARAMLDSGSALVSEYPLDAGPLAGNFPRRNRIISGLSLGVLVVEASIASGSLITARLAAEQGREVYAIPGSIHHPGAKGCHQLIRDGALLVESVEQILDSLRGWQNLPGAPVGKADHPLLALLHAAPHTSEGLAHSSGQPLAQVLASLTELELEGRVSNEAGRWFARSG